MKTKQKYLVCPLNWGLGHASRMIPIVHQLIKDGHDVTIGGDGDALLLLQQAFPQIHSIYIKDIHVRFEKTNMLHNLLLLIPKIIYSTIYEHFKLKKIIKTKAFDVIISDNRYGLWSKKTTSILVTHQLMVKMPAPFQPMEYGIHLMIKWLMRFYDQCWVPDYREFERSLSGDLSRKYPTHKKVKFIEPLSHFKGMDEKKIPHHYNVVVVLSGPEPLKSQLQNKLAAILSNKTISCLIIQGNPQKAKTYVKENNITYISHLPPSEIKYLIKNADNIICRSGYSSIMDLDYLHLNAILIPTPGQTEQEYLAKHLQDRFQILNQDELTDEKLMKHLKYN